MPLQKPHPPILIGGMGPKKTLKFVAKYANATNLFSMMGLKPVENALNTLKEHCKNEGRDYNEIEKTTLGSVFLGQTHLPDETERKTRIGTVKTKTLKTAEVTVSHLKDLANIGISHAIFNMRNPLDENNPLDIFKNDIIPAVRDL